MSDKNEKSFEIPDKLNMSTRNEFATKDSLSGVQRDSKETEVIEIETVDPNLTNDGNILASRSSVDCITPEMHETNSVEVDFIADLIAETESLDELDLKNDVPVDKKNDVEDMKESSDIRPLLRQKSLALKNEV